MQRGASGACHVADTSLEGATLSVEHVGPVDTPSRGISVLRARAMQSWRIGCSVWVEDMQRRSGPS
jgi:hypothetical protein